MSALAPTSLLAQPYFAYAYSYPHKSAYGPLDPVPLEPLWRTEGQESLFLYVHLPFCEMRCAFCNLFTRAGADDEQIDNYLDAVERQARAVASGTQSFSRLALGGGTPTFLTTRQLVRLFDLLARQFGVEPTRVPTAVETSPQTATDDRLALLRALNVRRISLGVQSFVDTEVHAIGRPQTSTAVLAALERIRRHGFPVLNIDLIYGQPGQTRATWLDSIRAALRFAPEELFLYPLYVRPETGLARRDGARGGRPAPTDEDLRRDLYRAGRDELLAAGYEQLSMRCFRLPGSLAESGPAYCCQTDGMLGLGCGARSYTSRLHYGSRFAVSHAAVLEILQRWQQQTPEDFAHATWGIWLSDDERRRRFAIQSLLQRDGLDEAAFAAEFGLAPVEAIPELAALLEHGFAERAARLRLTDRGLELSDSVGPALYSPACRAALARFVQLEK